MFRALLLLGLATGCASDKYLSDSGHRAFNSKNYEEAAKLFEKSASKPGANQLLFLLDEASALIAAGKYEAASKILLRAEDLAAVKDYTSISEEVGTLVTSDNVKGYKGEDFEKVLINVYLALCFASTGKLEDAHVEARKINLLLYRMINEGKRNYKESPFARYFSAMLWEAGGNWNDAYIDYKKTYELDGNFPHIEKDLLSMARKMRFLDEVKVWSERFPSAEPRVLQPGDGELVLVFEKGLSPTKIPRDGENSSLPRFAPRYSSDARARVIVDGVTFGETEDALDIEGTSIRYLEDRIGRMVAAKVAGTIAKGALAYGVKSVSKNEDLGWLTFFLLMAADRADLRSWRSLPASLQMLRLPVKAGVHSVRIEVLGDYAQVLSTKDLGNIEIIAGKKIFLTAR